MTFGQLALSNVRGSMLRYAAFFLSSAFSVLLFFLYAQVVFHPELGSGYIYGEQGVRMALVACQLIIIVFSFFFVLYSSSTFLAARGREFGLLTLLGTTRAQLMKIVWLENTILSLAAIVTGIGFGVLFTRLFLLALSRILAVQSPIRFMVVPEAVALTAVGFFVLFQAVTLVGMTRVGRRDVIGMLRTPRMPKDPPRASVSVSIAGLLLVATGYVLAVALEGALILVGMLPVIGVVMLGTYLLFAQGSVYLLGVLQRIPHFYLAGTNLLVISQLVFKMRDNARLLASVATLSALVLSASGTFYTLSSQFSAQIEALHPQALTIVEPGDPGRQGPDPREIDAILARHGVQPTVRVSVPALAVTYSDDTTEAGEAERAALISFTGYRSIVQATGVQPRPSGSGDPAGPNPSDGPDFGDGPATTAPWYVRLPSTAIHRADADAPHPLLGAGTESVVAAAAEFDGPFLTPVAMSGPWFVTSDVDFAARFAVAVPSARARLYAFDWRASPAAREADRAIGELLGTSGHPFAAHRFSAAAASRQMLALTMFIGLFVTVLFFIGAGSMIYFKLFAELPEDRRLFASLRRIGITSRETDGVVTSQMAVIFFLPFLVGAVHAVFALTALGNLLSVDVTAYALVVIGLFALVQASFFGLTRWTYLRSLRPAH